MKTNIWIVAKNRHIPRLWESGGTAKDYPEEHWYVYKVVACNRKEAVRLGQKEHQKIIKKSKG